MTAYLGSLGRMVPVDCAADLSVERERITNTKTTLGGRRFVRSAPRGHRSWSGRLSGLSGPGAGSVVESFASGDWGDGPFWWLSPWAVKVNVLTPGGSVLRYAHLAGGTVSAPVQAVDGTWFPVSVVAGSGGVNGVARSEFRTYTAVPTGTPYTAGLYVSAGQRVRVTEYGADLGVSLGSVQSGVASGAGLSRVSVSSTAGAGTAALRVDVVGAGVCSGASLSLTSKLAPWGKGDGCEEVAVRDSGLSVTTLAYSPRAAQSFEVWEVG